MVYVCLTCTSCTGNYDPALLQPRPTYAASCGNVDEPEVDAGTVTVDVPDEGATR